MELKLNSRSVEETRTIARNLSRYLEKGDAVLFGGELGAGKTTFIKAVVESLGIQELVVSPTFILVRSYSNSVKVLHFDLYRLSTQNELEGIGFRDLISQNAIFLVEWPDLARGYFENPLEVKLTYTGEESRLIELFYSNGGWEKRLKEFEN